MMSKDTLVARVKAIKLTRLPNKYSESDWTLIDIGAAGMRTTVLELLTATPSHRYGENDYPTRAADVLLELVVLRDMSERNNGWVDGTGNQDERHDYNHRLPLAWQEAREVVANIFGVP